MNVCRRGDVVDQELAGGVGKSVNLVAVVNLVVFLRPPGVNILLALLGRLIIPQLAAPALLDELIFLTRIALLGGSTNEPSRIMAPVLPSKPCSRSSSRCAYVIDSQRPDLTNISR